MRELLPLRSEQNMPYDCAGPSLAAKPRRRQMPAYITVAATPRDGLMSMVAYCRDATDDEKACLSCQLLVAHRHLPHAQVRQESLRRPPRLCRYFIDDDMLMR